MSLYYVQTERGSSPSPDDGIEYPDIATARVAIAKSAAARLCDRVGNGIAKPHAAEAWVKYAKPTIAAIENLTIKSNAGDLSPRPGRHAQPERRSFAVQERRSHPHKSPVRPGWGPAHAR